MKPKPQIIFLPIRTNQHKIESICQTIQKHFEAGDTFQILAPGMVAVQYLDDLLWKYPESGFLPHRASEIECKENIVITTQIKNLNGAKVLMNLCTNPCLIAEEFEILYELYDETQPDKFEQSKQRHQVYSQKGYSCIFNQ